MNLPPRALQALVDLKAELLLSEAANRTKTSEPRPIREEKPRRSHVIRGARSRGRSFQNMRRSHRFGW